MLTYWGACLTKDLPGHWEQGRWGQSCHLNVNGTNMQSMLTLWTAAVHFVQSRWINACDKTVVVEGIY